MQKMQREISDRAFLRKTVSLLQNAGISDAIHRAASNYKEAKNKVRKIR